MAIGRDRVVMRAGKLLTGEPNCRWGEEKVEDKRVMRHEEENIESRRQKHTQEKVFLKKRKREIITRT